MLVVADLGCIELWLRVATVGHGGDRCGALMPRNGRRPLDFGQTDVCSDSGLLEARLITLPG
jgi:hypothetical protein